MNLRMCTLCCLILAFSVPLRHAAAQGQDSTVVERDRQVIETLIVGVWNNRTQNYFDGRVKVAADDSHGRAHVTIEAATDGGYSLNLFWGGAATAAQTWSLSLADGADAVEMTVRQAGAKAGARACTVLWRREAAQFRGTTIGGPGCAGLPATWVLAEQQLWLSPLVAPDAPVPATAYKLHRTRPFYCYADMPGVGGGRVEPFERYGEFAIHDGGGLYRFRPKDAAEREIGISLWRIDWPINNYDGVFTRDLLVLSIIEFMPEGSVKEHGYSLTEPDVTRLGINLKWILVSCYMQSNTTVTPFM